ncbi:MAG: DEAD/DEAH box helicase family protein [Candidatus Moeniiplasma glomeromycotorum]|nr:DEAD/DEAH box helicase family protein [Candidatus Moeniiplasma glomeromycotorum]MCE8168180.1 DEAD/DEAH box helicase family protein [Candidatus Moeniiplasma glomeromycotorum]MCE8169492.1 DEAD/DEAH box helicase family protein [Candidatus Moeniiplasma glomeromycotorum]
MLELFDFQEKAALKIVEKYENYFRQQIIIKKGDEETPVPFIQILDALTGSGKTVILAKTIGEISKLSSEIPIILWLSKASVVVEQSFNNLTTGGKYHHLLGKCQVIMLAEYQENLLFENEPLVLFATVGTFNQKDKEAGNRQIYQCKLDEQNQSTWDSLKNRNQRPLFIVYDEAHNLSDQQTNLLLELKPTVFLMASATIKFPKNLVEQFEELKKLGQWEDKDFFTQVPTNEVVEAGLVKKVIQLASYENPREETITSLVKDLKIIENQLQNNLPNQKPKAIYVCRTNVLEYDPSLQDNIGQNFTERKAPPILIWRHLVEKCQVKPENIAVYCDLKFSRDYPKPPEFNLFAGGGEKKYQEFTSGDFQHIIFNLGLQEGWDDPLVYCAYIDRLLNSSLAVKQIIGRVLRQPKPAITHQLPELLNTAHFYIQVEKQSTFQEVIKEINQELEKNGRGIDIKPTTSTEKPEIIEVKNIYQLPKIICNAVYTEPEITKIINQIPDWREDKTNTRGDSYRTITKKYIDEQGNFQETVNEKSGNTDKITARAIFYREIIRKLPQVRGVILLDEPKFDALIGFKSNVYGQIVETVDKVIKTYLDNCQLEASETELYTVTDHLLYNPAKSISFNNSIHEKYSQLNELEKKFARELDEFGFKWCRNPSRTGYSIPLITLGSTRNFYPDFLIFHPTKIIAIDTSGEHLIKDKVDRKLLNISSKLLVYFVSRGKWDEKLVEKTDESGWTLWKRRVSDGNLSVIHQENLKEIIERMLERIK